MLLIYWFYFFFYRQSFYLCPEVIDQDTEQIIDSLKSYNARLKGANENLQQKLVKLRKELDENRNATEGCNIDDIKLTEIKLQMRNAESGVKRLELEVEKREQNIMELNQMLISQTKEVENLRPDKENLMIRYN